MIDQKAHKIAFLIEEARRWVGVEEQGNNSGQLIQIWQKAIDAKAVQEPWCMCFVQSQIKTIDNLFYKVFGITNFSKVYQSEHCFTVWQKSPQEIKSKIPVPGAIAVWKQKDSTSGHTGIVVSVNLAQKTFKTIEGNTSPGGGIVREGQGVYEKTRTMDGQGNLELLGFLTPWP